MAIKFNSNDRILMKTSLLHKQIKFSLLSIALLLLTVTSCNNGKISGTIKVASSEVSKGDTVDLQLIPDSGFEEIYGISWEVEPKDVGYIVYESQPDRSERTYKEDRNAQFFATKQGKCKISAHGYFKQTNPQPIAELELSIK